MDHQSVLTHSFDLVVLIFEEALRLGYEADYGYDVILYKRYWVEIYAVTESDFSAILKSAHERFTSASPISILNI